MPIITLLTDFGSRDYFVGAMKGVILAINPAARIVDVTHETPPGDINAAAFNLLTAYKDFPKDTIHVVVVDPGVGSERRGIAIQCARQFFVGPDNGAFGWVCEREGNFEAVHLSNDEFFRHPISQTFHGRDIFAPVAAALSNGIDLKEFGPVIDDVVRLESLQPMTSDGVTEARIIHIDRFGNCITNLTREDFAGGRISERTLLVNGREISSFREFFADGRGDESELFCLFGSAGFLEIAAQNLSAAKILDARIGHVVTLLSGSLDRRM